MYICKTYLSYKKYLYSMSYTQIHIYTLNLTILSFNKLERRQRWM